jgi:hypothetical protein
VKGLRTIAAPPTVGVCVCVCACPNWTVYLNIMLCVQHALALILIFLLRFVIVFLNPSMKILVYCITVGHDHILYAEQVA